MDNINNSKEYTFTEAWVKLFDGNIITSKNSNYSYAAEKSNGIIKLKFYNPVISIWQLCTFFSSDELLDKWYINKEVI